MSNEEPRSAPAEIAHAFHIPGPGPYALTHSVGCLPKLSLAALETGYLRPWMEQGGDVWNTWLQQTDAFRGELAALFGGSPAEYCPQTNLSSALSKVLTALPSTGSRKRVLLAGEDSFPSLGFVLQQAERNGFALRLIPRASSPADIETWSAALSADVRLALITHVHSNSGAVAPVADITRLCAERGIFSILDVAQSAGILPLSFPRLGADVVLGSCVKWLCGGPGAGFIWIPQSIIETLEPTDVGWFSHADPFQFDIHSFSYAPDARRFWGGTPSIAPFTIAAASLGVLRQIGVETILAHNRKLMQTFVGELPPAWRAKVPSGKKGGTLCIPAGASIDGIKSALSEARVRFDCRDDIVRLSFHLCNRMEDAAYIARAWAKGART